MMISLLVYLCLINDKELIKSHTAAPTFVPLRVEEKTDCKVVYIHLRLIVGLESKLVHPFIKTEACGGTT